MEQGSQQQQQQQQQTATLVAVCATNWQLAVRLAKSGELQS